MQLGKHIPKKISYYGQLKFKVHTENTINIRDPGKENVSVNQICISGLKERLVIAGSLRKKPLRVFITSGTTFLYLGRMIKLVRFRSFMNSLILIIRQ